MNIQIGAGDRPMRGFVNIDLRDKPGTVRGHAHQIPVEDGTVDLLFSNALFEHLFLAQQIMALREWERVVAPDGVVVCVGIPDFEHVARAYLDRGPGILREKFDLLEAYRYTHGSPENYQDNAADWLTWSPGEHPNDAPAGWLPALHKAIFDGESLSEFCTAACGLHATVVRYCYPGETLPLNLGFVAGHVVHDPVEALRKVPGIGAYIDFGLLEVVS